MHYFENDLDSIRLTIISISFSNIFTPDVCFYRKLNLHNLFKGNFIRLIFEISSLC